LIPQQDVRTFDILASMNIEEKDVGEFLNTIQYRKVDDIKLLAGGKHSEAFSFRTEGDEKVIRFNETDFGFKKDKYAYENYSKHIFIPKILEIGTYKDIFYSVSEKINGHSVREEYNENNFTSLKLQFDVIEEIASIPLPTESQGCGEWDPVSLAAPHTTLSEVITSLTEGDAHFNWNTLQDVEGFELPFFNTLKDKITNLLLYSENVRELRHGDFGNENILIENGQISGIIDWHKASYDDHLFDVGRVVLYCPDRNATSKAALDYYKDSNHKNYKERILLGVYITMLVNYGFASKAGSTASLKSSPTRISEIEEHFLT
jgi:hygromycin-B 4-O-kinase